MTYANEARKIAKANRNTKELDQAIEKILPAIDTQINIVAKHGCTNTLVKTSEIMRIIGFTLVSKKDILEKLMKVLREYGYDVSIPTSQTSIHIYWDSVE